MHMKMSLLKWSIANNDLKLLTNLSIEANSVDQDQTAPHCLSYRLIETFQQTAKADDFCCDWRFWGQHKYNTVFPLDVL